MAQRAGVRGAALRLAFGVAFGASCLMGQAAPTVSIGTVPQGGFTGSQQTLTVTAYSPNGPSFLTVISILINNFNGGRSS